MFDPKKKCTREKNKGEKEGNTKLSPALGGLNTTERGMGRMFLGGKGKDLGKGTRLRGKKSQKEVEPKSVHNFKGEKKTEIMGRNNGEGLKGKMEANAGVGEGFHVQVKFNIQGGRRLGHEGGLGRSRRQQH